MTQHLSTTPRRRAVWRRLAIGVSLLTTFGCGEDPKTSTSPTLVLCAAGERVEGNACVTCPPGTTNEAGDDASGADTTCDATLCGANERVEGNQCVACPAGTMSAAGADASGGDTSCGVMLCAEGERVVGNACAPCPAGTTNAAGDDASGADTSCDATLCGANERVVSSTCVTCPAGATNAAGDDASGADTTCDATLCEANERVLNNACAPCPDGATNAAGDDASGANTSCDTTLCEVNERVVSNQCVACPPGTVSPGGDDRAGPDTLCDTTFCPPDLHVVDHTCVTCPPGTTNAAGDAASGGDTSCDGVLCGEDERVVNNTCVACPAGASNRPGDDASGGDTSCDGVLCASGERVLNNACVACPAGTTNAAGDDASGQNTSCDAVLCGEDERVVSNQCVACPTDQFNAAGDDASGADTMCVDACARDIGVSCLTFGPVMLGHSAPTSLDAFGRVVVIDADTVAVGAPLEDSSGDGVNPSIDNAAQDSGSVHVFARSGGGWVEQAFIKDDPSEASARFGKSLDLDGDTLVVGSNSFPTRSAAVFARSAGVWTRQGTLLPQAACTSCGYGDGVAVSGDRAFITRTAPGAGGVGTTVQIEVFRRVNGAWSFESVIDTGETEAFGLNIAARGDLLLVGLPNDSSTPQDPMSSALSASGVVLVFERGAGGWTLAQRLKASDAASSSLFGSALAVDQGWLVVGAAGRSAGRGAAYVFKQVGGSWAELGTLVASNPDGGDSFGQAVAISGDRLIVGAPREASAARGLNGVQADNSAVQAGAAYLFARTGDVWQQIGYVKAPPSLSNFGGPQFGVSVSMDSGRAVIGRQYGDGPVSSTSGGSAHVFQLVP